MGLFVLGVVAFFLWGGFGELLGGLLVLLVGFVFGLVVLGVFWVFGVWGGLWLVGVFARFACW
ncbi:hypothetical protein, partial [Brucella melitensis]|uniref:hypothetical protein n=1 Tax=Brucella melitensis TaxID=29459 RepID=UPI001AED851F